MSDASLTRLRALAAVWNDLARLHPHAPFHTEFFQDLERVNRFQEDFPGKPDDLLVAMLEHKVLRTLCQQHSESEVRQARARLARPDPENVRTA